MAIEFTDTGLAENEVLTKLESVDDLGKGYVDLHSKVSAGSIELLPEDIRKDPTIANYKTLPDLAKGLIETKKLVGQKGVIVPGPNATPEEREKFFASIGRPEKADAYKLTPVDKLHPDIKITPESSKGFLDVAHKAGLTNAQADFLNSWYLQAVSQSLTQRDKQSVEAAQAADKSLRMEFGKDFDRNLSLAKKIVTKFGGKDAVDAFGELGNNPAVIKTFAAIGKAMSEDQVNHIGFSVIETDQRQAISRIKQIESDPAFMNERDPKHDALVKERTELYGVAYSGGG